MTGKATSSDTLTPDSVTARFEPHGRMPFGFGPRFFLGLLIGLIWLLPAWWFPRLIAGMVAWDTLLIVVSLTDLRRLPAPRELEGRRVWSAPLSFARPASVSIEISGFGARFSAIAVDHTAPSLREHPPILRIERSARARQSYWIVPRARGEHSLGKLFLRYRSALGMAERWAVADLSQSVRVLPDLDVAARHSLYLIRSRQVDMEKRLERRRGSGREFESLRDYRQGDDLRAICWPATARRHQLTTRIFEAERSQAVWIVIDAGRLLRAQVWDKSRGLAVAKLDFAADTALALAQVASQAGDRVGMLAYGRSIQQLVGLGHGPRHLRSVIDALSMVRQDPSEADHALAARTLVHRQTRRALIVWITDFAETAIRPEVIEHAAQMSRRHVVVFAAMGQPDLVAVATSVPRDEDEMFRHAAALEIVERRELLLNELRRHGVFAVDLAAGQLASTLINQYLRVKDRDLL